MPMFATSISKRLTAADGLPGADDGDYVEIRSLSHYELAEARTAYERKAAAQVKAMGGFAGLNIDESAEASEERRRKVAADPTQQYDVQAILEAGIVAWSSDTKPEGKAIRRLTPPVAEFLMVQIVELTEGKAGASGGNPTG